MYVGIDIGGTKTLVAVLDQNGVIVERLKFQTPDDYSQFLIDLRKTFDSLETKDFDCGGMAVPAVEIDRKNGVGISFGNLPWKNVTIQDDVEKIFGCPIVIENDAKLGGLSESMLLKGKYRKVLYVTVSTGIGLALVVDNKIDSNIFDGGGRTIVLEHRGKFVPWESFASGRAIVERYGKKAADINDEATWKKITQDLSLGLIEVIAITEPDIVVIGGSVGRYFEKYGELLDTALQKYHLPLAHLPPVIGAQRPEDAVIYGCYDLAKDVFGKQ